MALRLARRRACDHHRGDRRVWRAVGPGPRRQPVRPQPPLRQLATDLRALTAMPGVKRGALGHRGVLADAPPAAVRAEPADAARAGVHHQAPERGLGLRGRGLGLPLRDHGVGHGTDRRRHAARRSAGRRQRRSQLRLARARAAWRTGPRRSGDLGIQRIEGRIIGDDDAVEEPRPALAWAWDDLGYSSGVLFGALNTAGEPPRGDGVAGRRSRARRRS